MVDASFAEAGEQVSVSAEHVTATCLKTVRWGGRRYRIERGWERWYVDVCPDGEIDLATGFRAGVELESMPEWVRETAQEIAPGGKK